MRTGRKTSWWRQIALAAIIAGFALPTYAQDDQAAELAKKLEVRAVGTDLLEVGW